MIFFLYFPLIDIISLKIRADFVDRLSESAFQSHIPDLDILSKFARLIT